MTVKLDGWGRGQAGRTVAWATAKYQNWCHGTGLCVASNKPIKHMWKITDSTTELSANYYSLYLFFR